MGLRHPWRLVVGSFVVAGVGIVVSSNPTTDSDGTVEDRYDVPMEALLAEAGVSRAQKPGFGSSGLFAGGKLS